jgi:hypothetical protein
LLHARFDVSRIDHGQLYNNGSGTYPKGAVSFLSRMRRAEIGHPHRMPNRAQVKAVTTLAMAAPTSVDWRGYWQRSRKAAWRAASTRIWLDAVRETRILA